MERGKQVNDNIMDHLTSSIRRLFPFNIKHDLNNDELDLKVKMSDLNHSYSDSIKNMINNSLYGSIVGIDESQISEPSMQDEELQSKLNEVDMMKFMDDLKLNESAEKDVFTEEKHGDKKMFVYEKRVDESNNIKVLIVKISVPKNCVVNEIIAIDELDSTNNEYFVCKNNKQEISRDEDIKVLIRNSSPNKQHSEIMSPNVQVKIEKSKNLFNTSQPVMGTNALIAKTKTTPKKHNKTDSDIIQELVIQRFADFLDKYTSKMRNRNSRVCKYDEESDTDFSDISMNKVEATDSMLSKSTDSFQNMLINGTISPIFPDKENSYSSIIEMSSTKKYSILTSTEENISSPIIQRNSSSSSGLADMTYSVSNFLEDALGDQVEYISSCGSHVVPHYTFSENQSVGTSNISDLLSKTNSLSVVNQTFDNTKRLSPIIPEEVSTTTENDTYSCEENSRNLSELIAQINMHTQIMNQTLKALSYCKRVDGLIVSFEELEAEKYLLMATKRRDAYRAEIQRLENEEIYENPPEFSGEVTINSIMLPMKLNSLESPEKKRKDYSLYFMAVLQCGPIVQSAFLTAESSDTAIYLEGQCIFENLPPDFKIEISIYETKIKNNIAPFHPDPTYHENKITMCPSPSKIFNSLRHSPRTIRQTEESSIKSSFTLAARSHMTIGTIKNLGYLKLMDMPPSSTLEGRAMLNFVSGIKMPGLFEDFLNIAEVSKSYLSWMRMWAALKGPYLYLHEYPGQEPFDCIDLRYCLTAYITAPDRMDCDFPRSLVFETAIPSKLSEDGTPTKILKYFIAADNNKSYSLWRNKLNDTVAALRNWNCMKCNFMFPKRNDEN